MLRAALVALTMMTALLVAPQVWAAPRLPVPNSHGLTLLELTEAGGDPRMLDAVVATDAIFQPVHVRIYLPAGYRSKPGTRYPSLYLLHGGGDELDDARSWPDEGEIARVVDGAGYRGIVVMPEAGKAGYYTDWARADPGGRRPRWEKFHIGQLLPWIDANFRTTSDRAITGLSMGGFGALSYAARHPELFSAAGSFSGTTNLRDASGVIGYMATASFGTAITDAQEGRPEYLVDTIEDMFGPYWTWPFRNPYDLANVYRWRGIKVALYSGNGSAVTGFDAIESTAKPPNDAMHSRLRAAGVADRYCTGDGEHTWSFWQHDLADFLHWISGATPRACPNNWGQPKV